MSTLARSQTPDKLLTEIVDQILMRHIRPTRLPAAPQRNSRREASLRRIAEYFHMSSGALPHDSCAQTLQFCAPP